MYTNITRISLFLSESFQFLKDEQLWVIVAKTWPRRKIQEHMTTDVRNDFT